MICQQVIHACTSFYYAGVDIGYIVAAIASATVLIIIGIVVSTCIILFVWIRLQKSYRSSTSQNLKSNAKVTMGHMSHTANMTMCFYAGDSAIIRIQN